MSNTMKAAFLEDINTLTLKEVPIPEVGDDEALLKVRTCAICGSDLRILHNGHPMVKFPQIIGHEVCGDVIRVGKNVTRVKVGDRVALAADVPCGHCPICEQGHGNFCPTEQGIGYSHAGGFAEYMLLNGFTLANGPVHVIPDNMTYEQGSIAEPLGCIINGMERIKPQVNDIAVIMGAGPIGCMMIPVLYRYGCSKVIVTDLNRTRLDMARRFNADCYICSSEEDSVRRVMEETNGLGANIVITANPAWQSHVEAMKLVRFQGTVCFFGGLPEGRKVPEFDTNVIHYKELTVVGSHGSVARQHQTAIDMIASGKLDIMPIITHHFPLSKIKEAFAVAEGQEGLKVVIDMDMKE